MEFFLSAILSCSDGQWILDGLARADLTRAERRDLVVEIKRAMPDDCVDVSSGIDWLNP